MFKLALICGGPSLERGISLNSARSVMDHLRSFAIEVYPLYVNTLEQFYLISPAQLYCNTPADFDYKIASVGTPFTLSELELFLKGVDLVFSVIHGLFGEDGQLQSLLEKWNIPFVGSSSVCCNKMFCKIQAADFLKKHGFFTLDRETFYPEEEIYPQVLSSFFSKHPLAIVKPSVGGSSLGVSVVKSVEEAFQAIEQLLKQKEASPVLLEPFCRGTEFTVLVLQNDQKKPVALVPTQIELQNREDEIFDFRKKYLPTNQASYHTPPLFSLEQVKCIQENCEFIFELFGMRDFVRIDGWVLADGTLYFSDINPVSGLEQNSFLFRQAAFLGMSHPSVLEYILKSACERYSLVFPKASSVFKESKQPVFVLFGGDSAERQVSLMSGSNVWLKLLHSKKHEPFPFFFDVNGDVWKIPYAFALHHTVEEIYTNCLTGMSEEWAFLVREIQHKLRISLSPFSPASKMSFSSFLQEAKEKAGFVFIGMHGGKGEDGTLQSLLERYQIPYNGSNSKASSLCMDKYLTGDVIRSINDPDLLSLAKKHVPMNTLVEETQERIRTFWEESLQMLESNRLLIKPRHDGCSSGIIPLSSFEDFSTYIEIYKQKKATIPPGTFFEQFTYVEMPQNGTDFILEPYIETDRIFLKDHLLYHQKKKGWMELTIGVLEKGGSYRAFNPSITLSEGAILSLEEKFQGGTGINLTPPPEQILCLASIQKIKQLSEKAAGALGIQNYARLDLFFNTETQQMIVIEANTLPALTPSTVLYHQGLAEEIPLSPLELLETIIDGKMCCE